MGSVELIKPGKTKEEVVSEPNKPFQFDSVFDWK